MVAISGERTGRRARLGRRAAFWSAALVLGVLMAGSALVSPLYGVYQAAWHFSSATLTEVFAVYAGSLLLVLLMAGSVSDRLGRRSMLGVSMVAEAAAAVVFLDAHGVAALFVGRVLQGVASGSGVGAVGAALIEFQPPRRPGAGGAVNAGGSMAALAVGALGASALVQYGPIPTRLVYWLLLAACLAALALIAAMPEPVRRRPLRLAHLRPRAGVPGPARASFVAALPALVATWALGGLYLSLGPSIAAALSGSSNLLWGGLIIALLAGTGAAAVTGAGGWAPEVTMRWGCVALAIGSAATLAGLADATLAGVLAGTAVAGAGFGTAYLGAFRHLVSLADPDRRGALVASIYLVSYLAFSLPVVAAGAATGTLGLHGVAVVYTAGVVALSSVATALQVRRRSSRLATV